MAHLTVKSAYRKLEERINRAPQGAPPSKLLYEIYSMLFSEQEAEFVALMPIKPFDAEKAAKLWKQPLTQTQNMLDGLASRGLLMDIEDNGKSIYILPPPMAGFFEFSLMRIRSDIDQKKLSELFYKYITVEEDFIKDLMTGGETQLGRTFVN
ncbi:MAG TPA: (Fe-S)-binding protein, partial [bacterium]|nr:(Fe-S)-binding protein [bacterium]